MDCSDILILSDSTAIVAHNEDGNVALLGHTYVVALPGSTSLSVAAMIYFIYLRAATESCLTIYIIQLPGEDDAARRPVLHRLHVRRRAPQLRLRVQQQRRGKCLNFSFSTARSRLVIHRFLAPARPGIHPGLCSTGEGRDRRGRHCSELRVAGPAGSEEPRRCNPADLFTERFSRPQLQPDGRQRSEDRERRDRLREPVRGPRGRHYALLPRKHVPASPS